MGIECRIGSGTYSLPYLECVRACRELGDPEGSLTVVREASEGEPPARPVFVCSTPIERLPLFYYASNRFILLSDGGSCPESENTGCNGFWEITSEMAEEAFVSAFISSRQPQNMVEWQSIVARIGTLGVTSPALDLLINFSNSGLSNEDIELLYNLAFGGEQAYQGLLPRVRSRIVWEYYDYDPLPLMGLAPEGDGQFLRSLVQIFGQRYISVVTEALLYDPGLESNDPLAYNRLFFVDETITGEYLWLLRDEDINENDRRLFLSTFNDISRSFQAYPADSQERILLGRLLKGFQFLADKYNFQQSDLSAAYNRIEAEGGARDFDEAESSITFTELEARLGGEETIVTFRPENMPLELAQTLDTIGYYSFVVNNVALINMYGANQDNLAFAEDERFFVQGGEALPLSRNVYLSLYTASGRRYLEYELAAVLVHEAAHVQNPERGLRDERFAFNAEREFLEAFLNAELNSGRLVSDSILAFRIAQQIISVRASVLAADEVLVENPEAGGYPLDLSVDNTRQLESGAVAALGFNQQETNRLWILIVRLLGSDTANIEGSYTCEVINQRLCRTLNPRLSFTGMEQGDVIHALSSEEVSLFERFIVSLRFFQNNFDAIASSGSINMPGIASLREDACFDGIIWGDEADLRRYEAALAMGSNPAGIRMREYFRLPLVPLRHDIYSLNKIYVTDQYLSRL